MEHQVFVPVPAERLGAALADPARVARAVPGLQQDAGAEPITGRLKLRVGGHSVTYRGALRVTAREDGTYAVEGDATEARGSGSVKLALTLRLTDTDGGCTVTVEGTADADGRIGELPAEAVTSAATRLLNRWVEGLATRRDERQDRPDEGGERREGEREPKSADAESARTSVFDTEVPPPSLDADADDEGDGGEHADRFPGDFADTGEPPAEAAHARRTMIGRSAEEVDHAPPRGRYAPVPAPQTVTATSALRWAAPAAALAVASAIVVSRALRRRR
ncbi:SRPBCC family protein [Streptomyces sp. SP2-10]|uniref:SRPBCC family protein n=1 Tax=Streptomyces sp. SP2-10 TaxID=2873385 RepID=UPI001CA7987F|nr:SRPBCC family protein [Streptomyces sp. SP2-10]MBY8841825.1 SRPBCC family protein [Streptomyces sp. SP2-10]